MSSRIDDFDVVNSVNFSGDVDHVAFFETADDMDNRISFSDVGEEFISPPPNSLPTSPAAINSFPPLSTFVDIAGLVKGASEEKAWK